MVVRCQLAPQLDNVTVTDRAIPALVEQALLDMVGRLVAELGGGPRPAPRLDDVLDRDLGISSLERVELLLRIERAFGIRLPDSVMADAVTPRDLAAAIQCAAPAAAEMVSAPPQTVSPGIAAPAPTSARTLVEALRWHAERTPDRTHIHLRLEDGTEQPITYGELLAGSNAVAAGLQTLGVAVGDSVALMLRTEKAYFEAFFGALIAGAVPVPLYPPVRRDEIPAYVRRQGAILRQAAARVVLTFPEMEKVATLIRAQVSSVGDVATVERLQRERSWPLVERPLASHDTALVQFTSGSTGNPKGVVLTHANILANVRAIGEAIAVQPTDVTVSWLPLYHDMGLIGAWLGSLYFGIPVVLMSPLAFLARPERWLWAIHRHRGTVSPAPNFAFELVVRRIPDPDIEGLDLSSWRLAFNGSEVVSPETIERFTRRFSAYGFEGHAMCPVYGLAEASVGLTVCPIGSPPRVDSITRHSFEQARQVRPAAPDAPTSLRFVSCGQPIPGHDVRIVDDREHALGERVEGHVQFRGPSVMRSYYNNPEATRAVLHGGWMDSGDLGYWADDELFITGRVKDLIVLSGHNVYAQEVEDAAATVPGIRQGCVAAFGVHDVAVGTERLIVVAESRERDRARRDELRQAVLDCVVSKVGVPADVVLIADPGTVLKTSSGKIRRSATKDAYVRHTLGRRTSMARQWGDLLLQTAGARWKSFARWSARLLFTAWVATVSVLTLLPLWLYLGVERSPRRAERAVKRWSRLVLTLCGVQLDVRGESHLAGIRAGILVANHASYVDAIVLMAAIPLPFRFLAKRRLADYPLIGTVIRKAGHVTIEKTTLSVRLAGAGTIATLLRNDELLMIFPEGTFVRPPGLLPFRLGAFKAAVETGRPIIPIAIAGTRRLLPDGSWVFRHGPIEVTIGAPLQPRGDGWPEMVRLRDAAREAIALACDES
jgi:1-acyl-sn-glycerol-3-phosphate acyltransferase